MDDKPAPTLKDLYPHLNENELLEVEDTLDRYLALVLRIFERMQSEREISEEPLTPKMNKLGYAKQDHIIS